MLNGRLYDAKTLNEIGPSRPRAFAILVRAGDARHEVTCGAAAQATAHEVIAWTAAEVSARFPSGCSGLF